MIRPSCVALLLAFATGCSSAPSGVDAPVGRGLVTVDKTAPDGARIWNRPVLREGDRLVFRSRGLVDVAFRVQTANADGYVLQEETTGLLNRFTADLGAIGQDMPGDEAAAIRFTPFDATLTWPLWVGKTWASHYVSEPYGGTALPLLARYECDAVETIKTPAGSFECLRVWRRIRPAVDREYFEKCDVLWYAPEVGFFARKLEGGALTELQELDRQR